MYFCSLNTDGTEYTNLQLYSLKMAAREWNDLVSNAPWLETNERGRLKERLTFVVVCLGLSLSQLLGQNSPPTEKEKIGEPDKLLSALLNRASIERTKRGKLVRSHKELTGYYDAARHFGRNKDNQKHRKIDQLGLKDVERLCGATIEMWDTVIALHRRDPSNALNEFDSISELAGFDPVPGTKP